MKIPRRFLAVVLLMTIGATMSGCGEEIRVQKEMLEKTPIGTTFDQVLSFCKSNELKCRQSNDAGYLNQKTGEVVGVRSIWAVLSERRDAPLSITSISVYWGFDKEGRLLDIWVWKTVDAP